MSCLLVFQILMLSNLKKFANWFQIKNLNFGLRFQGSNFQISWLSQMFEYFQTSFGVYLNLMYQISLFILEHLVFTKARLMDYFELDMFVNFQKCL